MQALTREIFNNLSARWVCGGFDDQLTAKKAANNILKEVCNQRYCRLTLACRSQYGTALDRNYPGRSLLYIDGDRANHPNCHLSEVVVNRDTGEINFPTTPAL